MNSKRLRQEPWWTPTFTLNCSLGLHPTCTLLLAFSYMLCMSHTSYSSMTRLWRAHQMTIWVHNWMPFPDRQRPCTVSCWWHKTFLVSGVQWIWSLWCCVQTWIETLTMLITMTTNFAFRFAKSFTRTQHVLTMNSTWLTVTSCMWRRKRSRRRLTAGTRASRGLQDSQGSFRGTLRRGQRDQRPGHYTGRVHSEN